MEGLVLGVIGQIPDIGVGGAGHDGALVLEGLEGVPQVGPHGDALPGNPVLLRALEGGLTLLVLLLQLVGELAEGDLSVVPAPGADHQGHVVEEVEAVEGGGFVLAHGGDAVPLGDGALGLLPDGVELLVVEGPAADDLQLGDGVAELIGDVGLGLLGDRHGVVEGHINDDAGDIQLGGQILIPLEEGVADVVAGDHQVGQGHPGGGRVGQDLRGLPGHGLLLEQLHVADVHTAVGAAIHVVAQTVRHLQHIQGALPGADAGGVGLRVDHGDVHGHTQLGGRHGGGPAHQLAVCLGLAGLLVQLGLVVGQQLLGGHLTELFHTHADFSFLICSS